MTRTKKENRFLSNPWTIGIGTTILSAFLLRIIDWVAGTTILSSIITWITKIPLSIWTFLTTRYQLPLYGLILIFVSGPILFIVLLWVLSKNEDNEQKQDLKPDWLSYLKDNFNGVQYRWTYEKGYKGLMEIQHIRSFCPNCECIIIDSNCPNCNRSYWTSIKGSDEIKALILHRLERNYGVKVH